MKKKNTLKIKNFWRKNEKLILMIVGSFLLGTMIAGLNYLNHQDTQLKYQSDVSEDIPFDQPAEFEFVIEEPELASGTSIILEMRGAEEDSAVDVFLNGQEVSSFSGERRLIQVDSSILNTENTVRIEKSEQLDDDPRLERAEVTSTTNFEDLMFVILNFGSMMLIAAPIMWVKYSQFQRRKEMEEKFPEFLRDILEGTRAGMSLPQAIQNSETGSYGALDEKVDKLSAQLDWGIPFKDALQNFSTETRSKVIQQSVDTIIQAYSSGGDIEDVLESVGDNIRTIKELKEQRESQLYSEMITGYIVFFIFIGILIALTNFLLPNLADAQSQLTGGGGAAGFNPLGGAGGGTSLEENISLYESWFSRLVYIQALFSGLIIGKLSEGELKAGLKHTAILFAVGYLAVTFFL